MSSSLDLNPTSGGEPAQPSSSLPEPPDPPAPEGNDMIQSDIDVQEATTMMEETTITTDSARHAYFDEGEDEVEEEELAEEEVEVEIIDDEDDEDDDDMMAMLPEKVRHRIEKLRELNMERDAIMMNYLAERANLENKYIALCNGLYSQRLDIIQGKMDELIESEYTTEKAQDVPVEENTNMGDDKEGEDQDEHVIGVPQFWVCAMGHMETVAELVTERDVDCLEQLTNVTCEDFPDGKGFTLKFHFEPNKYFTNDILTKTYEIPNLLLDDEPVLKLVTGCTIEWKDPTKALTHMIVQKKQRSKKGKNAGQIRTVIRHERCDSFFHFFNPPKIPLLEDMDEDEALAIEEAFDHDYEVAQAFRNHLIPKGVLWFTGEALDEDIQEIQEIIEENVATDATAAVSAPIG